MSIQTTLHPFATAFMAALVTPLGMPAQDKPPVSVLPDDPEEVPRLVLTEDLPIIHVFEADCPSEGGWGAAALAALEEAAETDGELRSELANSLGARVLARDLCLSDLPRFESWLADQLRRRWSDGLLGEDAGEEDVNSAPRPFFLLAYIGLSQDSATQALVRKIAMDSTVTDYWRGQAAQTMITQRYGEDLGGKDLENDRRYQDAARSVLSDLASGPPLSEFHRRMEEWFSRVEVERKRKEPLRVARREGWARPEIPEACRAGFVPARRESGSGVVSDLIGRYYPDEMKRRGKGGTVGLTLQIDDRGNVRNSRVRESSGNRHFEEAAHRIARRLRFSPALMCNKPVRDVVPWSLRFHPSRSTWRQSPQGRRAHGSGHERVLGKTVAGSPSARRATGAGAGLPPIRLPTVSSAPA